jgi:hypothetical protein
MSKESIPADELMILEWIRTNSGKKVENEIF